jgi:ACDE family multidrug resistance protein
MAWQDIIKIYAVIPLFLAFLVFWAFRDIGRAGNEDRHRPNVPAQIAQTRTLLKKTPRLWAITLVGGLRGMAFSSFITILPLYLTDELGLTAQARGLHIALLMLVGIGFTPLMGYLSDRLNRKLILIPGMLFLGVMTLLLVPFGDNQIVLIAILALLGTFLFSDQPILTAAALDIVGTGVAATTLGVLSFSRFALSALSPVIGTALYQMNFDYTFYYIASIFGLAILILTFIPLPKVQHAGPEHEHTHEETSSDSPHSHH